MNSEHRGGALDYSLSGPAMDAIESMARGQESTPAVSLFTEHLRALLARYRDDRAARDTTAPNAEVLQRVQRIASQAEALRVELAELPAHAEALVFQHAYNAGRDDLLSDLDYHLLVLSRALMASGREVATLEPRRGEKPKHLEDALLAEVSQLALQFCDGALELSAWRASEILRAAGVHGMPDSGKKARERVRRWEKRTPPR